MFDPGWGTAAETTMSREPELVKNHSNRMSLADKSFLPEVAETF
jgi:hypothetical protein